MKSREHVITNGRAVFYACMWNDFRQAALDCGWGLALHGSLANDMDIMAMKWVEDAKSVEEMIKALEDCLTIPDEAAHFETTKFTGKPHGRVVYTIHIFADFYIDLSVIDSNALDTNLYESSFVECDLCSNRWVSVRPEGLTKLECPNCGNMVHFEDIKHD